MLLLNGFIGLELCPLMLCFGADSDRFKDEALHLKHMEWVIFFDCNSVFANVVEELLEERVVWMLEEVE